MATSPPDIFARLLPLRNGTVRGAVKPFGRIRFHYQSGSMRSSRAGTAFFVQGWNRTLLTAAHNVRTSAEEEPLRIQLTFPSAEDGKAPSTVFARAYAYPQPYALRSDIAVLVLPVELGVHAAPAYGHGPSTQFGASVVGFPVNQGFTLDRDPVSAQRAGVFYDYVSGQTDGGMSGGPLLWSTAEHGEVAVGIHLKTAGATSPGQSWAHDDDLIEACRSAAKKVLP